jgi:hypothetical protein
VRGVCLPYRLLDYIGEPREMKMQPVEHVALCGFGGKVADQPGLCRVSSQFSKQA